jgi:hypothetical protein
MTAASAAAHVKANAWRPRYLPYEKVASIAHPPL